MSEKELVEKDYDMSANAFRACCQLSREILIVLESLTQKEKRKVLSAAKSGWIKRMKMLDKALAKQGEP